MIESANQAIAQVNLSPIRASVQVADALVEGGSGHTQIAGDLCGGLADSTMWAALRICESVKVGRRQPRS